MEITRREFVGLAGLTGAALGLGRVTTADAAEPPRVPVDASGKVIPGFEKTQADPNPAKDWQPFSDRKIRVGIAGYGLCSFGAAWGFQNHPNVEVVAVTDLIPDRCAGLAKACRCAKTYPSCEEMINDDRIEAVFIATDAPSHARLAVAALQRGKHVASAVPAVFGSRPWAKASCNASQNTASISAPVNCSVARAKSSFLLTTDQRQSGDGRSCFKRRE